ncbi:MAG: OmpA family protein [Bacteroidetes bacterium]|nr:OmpA family protein [Bacteroidota bacterium]
MKTLTTLLLVVIPAGLYAQIGGALKAKATEKARQSMEKKESTDATPSPTAEVEKGKKAPTDSSQSARAYNNYDFIPGERVLFDDNLEDAQDGEFPGRWKLIAHQGVVNTQNGNKVYMFTESSIGSIAKITPRMKTASYLGTTFTVEFDFYLPQEETFELFFNLTDEEYGKFISFETGGDVKTNYFGNDLNGKYQGGELHSNWHHAAIAYKNKQIKIYLDQHRVLVIPDCEFQPVSLGFGGTENVILDNVKIADGGGMNMLNKIMTDGKFISHAVRFDVGKSTIKGESMGFLNELAGWLKTNAVVKLEIGGHTDSDGDDAANQSLSDERANAVRNQLISMGIAAERLTAKGYGETTPLDNNATPEGKANNRRVEFVKI